MADYKVVPIFPVKGFCFDDSLVRSKENKENIEVFLSSYKDQIIGEKRFHEGGLDLKVVNKITPHSKYDLMFIDGGEHFCSSIFDYDKSTIDNYWNFVQDVVTRIKLFMNEQPYELNLCYNFDPFTYDRESIMSEKRFHTHLILYSFDDICIANKLAVELSKVDILLQKRIVDPCYEVCCSILIDALKANGIDSALEVNRKRDQDLGLPLGVKFIVNDEWCRFLSEVMPRVHRIIISVYEDIMNSICTGKHGMWKRAQCIDSHIADAKLKRIGWLNSETRERLLQLVEETQTYCIADMSSYKNERKVLIQRAPLAGPAYSFACYFGRRVNEDVANVISIYPKIFSDMGGAGVTWIGNNNAVRVKRGIGSFSQQEIAERRSFQTNVLRNLLDEQIVGGQYGC